MIYGHIEQWMVDENPAFAEAVSRYYSLEHGKTQNAVSGELAWAQMAEELLDRPRLLYDAAYYGPLISRLVARIAANQAAERRKDARYFRSLATALETSPTNDEPLHPVEFLWEAYLFLRKRDGEGSPLPSKGDVKQHAALILAFADFELVDKLPEYLWQKRGLTKLEIRNVLRRQTWHLRPEMERAWKRYLKAAGLASLAQKQAGGRKRRE
jgi:hypothetical protein